MTSVAPHDNDVLFGRGSTISSHPGNRHLRTVVQNNKQAFLKARKKEKRLIAKRIVEEIQNLDPPGRFLIEYLNATNGNDTEKDCDKKEGGILDRAWIPVGTEKAVDKVMHRLREKDKALFGDTPKTQRLGQQQQQNPSNPPPPPVAAPLSNAPDQPQPSLPSGAGYLTRFLQNNMHQQQSTDNDFLSLLTNQAQQQQIFNLQQQQQQQQANQAVVMTNMAQSIQQPIRQLLDQQNEIQEAMQQAGMQPHVRNTSLLISQQSAESPRSQEMINHQQNLMGSLSSSGTNMNHLSIQHQMNHQQYLMQQDFLFGSQSVGLVLSARTNMSQQPIQQVGTTPLLSNTNMSQLNQQVNPQVGKSPLLPGASTSQPVQQVVNKQQHLISGAMNPQMSHLQQLIQQDDSTGSPQPQNNPRSFVGASIVASSSQSMRRDSQSLRSIREQSNMSQRLDSLSVGGASSFQSQGPPSSADETTATTTSTQSPFAVGAGLPGLQLPSLLTNSPVYQEVQANEAGRTRTSIHDIAANEEPEDFDAVMGSFLDSQASDHGQQVESQQQFRVITLRDWIDRSMPKPDNRTTPSLLTREMTSYIEKAIPLALKLTKFLMEVEEGLTLGSANLALMASITCENVLVRLEERKCSAETIVRVAIKSGLNGSPEPEANLPRLFSLGVVLYELFSSQSGKDLANVMMAGLSSVSVRRLSLSNIKAGDRPSKKSHRNPSHSRSGVTHGKFIAELEVLGIPCSLCALVRDLLDCMQCDLQGEDAYRSLADVATDLRLMRDDPSRFLDDLQVGRATFEIRNKFYGRSEDISSIERSYQRHLVGGCGGIMVFGGAGVGKSSLVSEATRRLTSQTEAYFMEAKFDQTKCTHPLSTIGTAFNSLCDMFAVDATQSQLEAVAAALHSALGNQADLLASVLPSLPKLTSCSISGATNECIDPAASMQFLLRKLLETLSEHRRVSFFLDDLQFADPSSLLLISSMLSNVGESSRVFFACCYRDDDVREGEGDPFALWLRSFNVFPLERMELGNIDTEGVNELVSETLHLFPRLTRPLASILHHKTRGNPLFLRQLLDLLNDRGYIHLNFSPLRWTWDTDKIVNLEISDDVVVLLIKEMQRLHAEFQLGLKVASCMGSCVKYSIFEILAEDIGVNLMDLLDQAVHRGYMVDVDRTKVRFAHDKIQQAAYELLPPQSRLENHMRFGLALTSHALDGGGENDELFFIAVHQINRGGPGILECSKQKDMIAGLNLRAGKRSMELSDFSTALSLFEHGIAFLERGRCWTDQYALSLELFDAAVETACALNNAEVVRRLSETVLARAKCKDDKLNCLYAVVKSLRLAFKFQESKKVAFSMLEQLGERLPRPMDDVGLATNIEEIKLVLLGMSDESILNMKETDQKKRDILMLNIYHELIFVFTFIDTTQIADASLRMTQITLSNGLCCMSPLAYAQFAIVLVNMGETRLGYRLGTIGLRLLKKNNAQRYTSAVIALVGFLVSWVAEPLQSIADSHLLGYKYGQINGDVVSGALNYQFYLQVSYLGGQSLSITRIKSREFARKLLQRKQKFMFIGVCSIHLQTVALIEGLEFEDEENETDKFPTWNDISSHARSSPNKENPRIFSSHLYMRSFLFKQYDEMPKEGLLDGITKNKVSIRPIFYYGIFFEGLVSFQLARQTDREEYRRKGKAALTFMRNWSECSQWNFESKYQLLEAEMMSISGFHGQASPLYEDAIRSSKEHKFIHEEAIASELAAAFFYERGLIQKSYSYFQHSVNCYKKWGALAIAKRIEDDILCKFGSDFVQLEPINVSLSSIFAPKGSSKKH